MHTALALYYARWKPSLRWSRAANRELFSYGMGSYAKRCWSMRRRIPTTS